jgi:hypothetical protein
MKKMLKGEEKERQMGMEIFLKGQNRSKKSGWKKKKGK